MNNLWSRTKEGFWNFVPALVILTVVVLKIGPSNVSRWVDDRLHSAERAEQKAAADQEEARVLMDDLVRRFSPAGPSRNP